MSISPRPLAVLLSLSALVAFGACQVEGEAPSTPPPLAAERPTLTLGAFEALLSDLGRAADSADARLHPLSLLRPREQAGLRRFPNRAQLERARALGVTGADTPAGRTALVEAGRLVALADSTRYWVVRDLDHSFPLVTPDTRALLLELGERFHASLARHDLPAFRFEVSSALRTPALQADLRQGNTNATRGTSTHEYGTTVDVAYDGFAAPAHRALPHDLPPAFRGPASTLDTIVLERVAARRSRELQALLGRVLLDMQHEGLVMVTLEELQPVFHMTVAAPLASR